MMAELCCHLGVAQTDMAEYFAAADSFKSGFAALEGVDLAVAKATRIRLKYQFGKLLSKGAGLNRGYEMQARIQLEQALSECRSLPRSEDAELFVAEIKAALSLVLTTQSHSVYVQAEQLASEAIETQEAAGDVTGLSESLNSYGLLLARQGRRAEARQAFQRNLTLRRRIFGATAHVDVAEALMNTASLEPAPEQALPLYTDAIKLLEDIVSEASHGQNDMMALVLAPALDGLGVTLGQLSRLDEAILVFRRALEIRRAKLNRHRDTATSASNLAHVLMLAQEHHKQKRPPSFFARLMGRETEIASAAASAAAAAVVEADSLLRVAEEILRQLDPQSQALAEALCQRAALRGQDKTTQRLLLSEALSIFVRELGEEHASVRETKELLESVGGNN